MPEDGQPVGISLPYLMQIAVQAVVMATCNGEIVGIVALHIDAVPACGGKYLRGQFLVPVACRYR